MMSSMGEGCVPLSNECSYVTHDLFAYLSMNIYTEHIDQPPSRSEMLITNSPELFHMCEQEIGYHKNVLVYTRFELRVLKLCSHRYGNSIVLAYLYIYIGKRITHLTALNK